MHLVRPATTAPKEQGGLASVFFAVICLFYYCISYDIIWENLLGMEYTVNV